MPDDITLTINEGESFGVPITLQDDDAVALVLATTVTVNGTIKSDFGGSPTTYATFDGGVVDSASGIIGVSLSVSAANSYVSAAESASAFSSTTTRTAEFGVFDINIDEAESGLSITGGSQTLRQVVVSGDYQRLTSGGSVITISGSTGNDGSYVSVGSTYDTGNDETTVTLDAALASATMDGSLALTRTTRIAQGTAFASREVTA